ncbi:MAG TPA: PASTA domain-containing protein [Streptosporangiaceae bacterium]|nr:PASTA domain-containing protein [Streptosporangiaceae bacterium]
MDDTLTDPLTGRVLDGRYAVTARIAHGGMATVYQATDTRLDREVALKVMHAELARDEEFRRRFIGEAKSVARLSHQNVVAVYDQGADGPFLYLAMEFVPGRTLKMLLRDSGRFAPATALEIMAGVLDGLASAHASGIVHRDVKPENVLVTADGRLKVADFGLARALSAAGHTRSGLLIGTVAYVPPEQVTGAPIGPAGDVYSAGVMLFELLTGRLPFTGDTPLSIAYQHVNQDVPAPSMLVPGIPPELDRLVLAATRRDPAQRLPDAVEFGRAVRHARDGLAEPGGFTGILGAGVQGMGEAPWLDLGMPAATSQITGGHFNDGRGHFNDAAQADSHTLVVDREEAFRHTDGTGYGDGGRHHGGAHHGGGREPLLGRWLFGPRLIIVALVIALGLGIGLGGWWLVSGRFTHVPTVSGVSVSQATAVLTADGFTVRAGRLQLHSNTVAKGMVVGTTPSGRVAKGTAVTIEVSSGPFTSRVPAVKGEKQADAQAAMQRAHLPFTIVKVGSNAKKGTVTGTSPAAGTTWPQTKRVTIMVADGPPLPDFTGMDYNAAQQLAGQYDVTLQQEPDNNSQQPPGIITGQQPQPGGTFQPGQTVTVKVSTGPQLVPVPDPIGMSVKDATQLLQDAGFQVNVRRFGFFDKVFDFSPVGQAPRGSTITLDVGF